MQLQKILWTNNNLGNANITNSPSLIHLELRGNSLSAFDASQLVNLEDLDLSNNQQTWGPISGEANFDPTLSSLNINGLSKLTYLNVTNQLLASLDLTQSPLLEIVDCKNNKIENSLDISQNSKLTYLDCSINQIKAILFPTTSDISTFYANNNLLENNGMDFSKLFAVNNINRDINLSFNKFDQNIIFSFPVSFASLDLSNNKISDFEISGNFSSWPTQAIISLNNNLLENINLSGIDSLENFFIANNPITELNMPNLRIVNYLDFSSTNISYLNLGLSPDSSAIFLATGLKSSTLKIDCQSGSIDAISDSENLESIDLSNSKMRIELISNISSLKNLYMKNGIDDVIYGFHNLPNLKFVCADENEIESIKAKLSQTEIINANVNSYCSFIPGGNYNTISGTAKIDTDNNGCDSTDNPFEYLKLKIDDGTTSGETFVQNDGKYEFYTQTGNFNVATLAENPTLFTVSPANFSTSFADANNNIFTQDICVTANGSQNDAEVVIAPLTNARPGFDAVYNLVWRNKGNTTLSGKVIMNYDSNKMTFQSSSLPYSILSNGSIEFNYTDLKPFANTASEITFKINTPTDSTNPVNMGDVLVFNAQITPTNADITPEDNLFGFNHTVVNSFDPNDIVCLEGETVPVSTVGKYLHYVINFENTGNAEAENIVVKMEVDPNEFDINTLQLQNASASVDTKIVGNQIEFAFKKIKLQSGGHGNVLLKMKSKSDLVEGDTVNNVAEIYFDYNFPIETNDYVTTIYNASDVLAAKINYSASNFSQNNYPINFDASLSSGNITAYQWEFLGNSSISSSADVKPVVTYNTPGNYTAKLTVFDSNGASSSQAITFSVGGNVADLSTGKNSENNFIAIDADEDDWKGYDINGVEITPKVRQTYTGWSYADIENGRNSQWITLNNLEGYYTYKSREFTIPDNATDAKLNLRSLSFVRNWTYLVKVNPDGSETETEITKTQWMNDGFKGWLNSRSPKVDNYSLSPGRYYIKVFLYSNNNMVRQSIDVNATVSCSEGLIFANKMVQKEPTLDVENSKNLEVQVYPIPTKGLINIISDEKINAVEVYDAAGRIIQKQMHSAASKESKVNISASKGIYYLKIKTNKGDSIKKIIKE
ncbi:T9SS type A sorting domain-containing protein [Epilithonimonas zeae]|uniref:Por secretion system C-terminal sorting domain-containing protein n=1 Tax=Epilithonimonas zeae TaxID=1416779 RepID=A0A1N6IWD6_9FLAO|nr:T9SS type A sorting domain-containing protein [Epilithonimonas zeae]SIO36353.1 Por secretion system C-terminal sorting domain-containing protein [Epilithonimonas zeae]